MYEYPDTELVNMVCERNEDAHDILYDKYKYIVDIMVNKYIKSAYALCIDIAELKQEALLGFSDALVSFDQDKTASLPTFISLCVERRVNNYVRRADTTKQRLLKEAFSLDAPISDNSTLKEYIGDDSKDPSRTLEMKENTIMLRNKINEILSPQEKEVFQLLLNDFSYDDISVILKLNQKSVYNAVARIKEKIKSVI